MLPNLNETDSPMLVPFHCDGLIDLRTQTVVAPYVRCPEYPRLEPIVIKMLQVREPTVDRETESLIESDFRWEDEQDVRKLIQFSQRNELSRELRQKVGERIRSLCDEGFQRKKTTREIADERGMKPMSDTEQFARDFRQAMLRIWGSENLLQEYIDDVDNRVRNRRVD